MKIQLIIPVTPHDVAFFGVYRFALFLRAGWTFDISVRGQTAEGLELRASA